MIACWDDHEVQNNYAGGDPDGGQVPRRRTRQRAQAPPTRRSSSDADLRLRRHAAACTAARSSAATSTCSCSTSASTAPRQPCGDDAGRRLRRAASDAAHVPRRHAEGVRRARPARVEGDVEGRRQRADDHAAQDVPTAASTDFDAWQGYPQDREAMLAAVRARRAGRRLHHRRHPQFIAGDVPRRARATSSRAEFVGSSITSASNAELDAR